MLTSVYKTIRVDINTRVHAFTNTPMYTYTHMHRRESILSMVWSDGNSTLLPEALFIEVIVQTLQWPSQSGDTRHWKNVWEPC